MPPKTAKVNIEQDADLLKAVIQVSGGVKGGIPFWKDVASAMNEDINGEAACKRFDKFKPGANVKSTLTSEKDFDLLKAIIKANGGVTGSSLKDKAFWNAVADAMEENINGEAARKRFDKFKPKGGDGEIKDGGDAAADTGAKNRVAANPNGAGNGKNAVGVKGEDGGDEDVQDEATAKKEPKKRAVAKPKAPKGAAKGKKAVKLEENNGSEEGRQDRVIAKMEDDFYIGGEEHAADVDAAPEKVNKAALDAYLAEGKTNPLQKRAYVEAWAEEVSSSGAGDEEELVVETPAKPSTNAKDKPAKKMKFEEVADQYES